MDLLALQQLGVSLGLGLLMGLQRERTERSISGIRTFPFIALFGTVCAQIGQITGTWIIAAGLISLAALVVTANLLKRREAETDSGMTTEIAALLVYVLGVLLVVGDMASAVVMGGGMALILHFKAQLHGFARQIGEGDMRAIIQFVLITMVILPVLPNADYGPHGVLNPFKIWLMVVLIVGISLSGYVAYKLLGARAGTILGGILGGLISSTATTVSFARRSARDPQLAPLGALVIMIASCIAIVRVILEIAAVAAGSFTALAPPLVGLLLVCCVITGGLWFSSRGTQAEMPAQENPTEIKPALFFAALYALVLLGVAFAKDRFGTAGLYAVALLSGLTDMDAITLSTAQLANSGAIEPSTAWRAILLGSMANFIFKLGTVAVLGPRALTLRTAAAFGLVFVAGGLIFWLWPG
jgi:uncharacterized membrane protein (DUF4010 family)